MRLAAAGPLHQKRNILGYSSVYQPPKFAHWYGTTHVLAVETNVSLP